MKHNPEHNGDATIDSGFDSGFDTGVEGAMPTVADDSQTPSGDDGGLVVTAVAGLAAMGVSMAARPVLNALYRQVTGNQPPTANDPLVPFGRALAWTVVSATTGAVLELIVQRTTRKFFGVRA